MIKNLFAWIIKLSYLGIFLMVIGNIRILFFDAMPDDDIRFKRALVIIIFLIVTLVIVKPIYKKLNNNDKKD